MAKDDALVASELTIAAIREGIAMMHAGAERLRMSGASASVQYNVPPELQHKPS